MSQKALTLFAGATAAAFIALLIFSPEKMLPAAGLFVMLKAVLHNPGEIRCNRRQYSWLPDWVVTSKTWFEGWKDIPVLRNADGYHVFKYSAFAAFAAAGTFYGFYISAAGPAFWLIAAHLLAAWTIDAIVFNLFYHYIFMKEEFKGKIWNVR